MPFQPGNKIGNRFKKGIASNPLGKTAGIPRTIRAKWQSVESGLNKAGIVLDIINEEIDTPEGRENLRQSIRDLMKPGDTQKTLRFLTFCMTFAPKVKQEALMAEFSGNHAALARAVAKIRPTTGSNLADPQPPNNGGEQAKSAQAADIGLDT